MSDISSVQIADESVHTGDAGYSLMVLYFFDVALDTLLDSDAAGGG